MEDSEKNILIVNHENKGTWNIKLIIFLLVTIVILSFTIYLLFNKDSSNGIIIRAKSAFKKSTDLSELQTATFTYNGVAKRCKDECKDDGHDEYLYYVSYEGDVTAGIDFDEIEFRIDKEHKKMIIVMPEVSITNARTYIEKQKFIFRNSKYDTVSELSEANRICNLDIKKRVSEDNRLLETAKENAKIVLEHFFEPWLNTYYSDYTLEVI